MHYQYEDIRVELLSRLEESKHNLNRENSKRIYIPTFHHHDAQNQLEICLRQISQENSEERILLIPYQLQNYVWVGVLLEFRTDLSIERAEYIDPMIGLETIPNEIQACFSKFYPRNILQIRRMEKSNNPNDSAQLTIINLSKAVATHSTAKENNRQQPSEILEISNSDLGRHELDSVEQPEEEIGSKNQQIQIDKRPGDMAKAEKELKEISDRTLSFSAVASSENIIDPQSIELPSTTFLQMSEDTSSDESSRKRLYGDELHHDLALMPECFEKTILELLVYFEKKRARGSMSTHKNDLDETIVQKLHDQAKKDKLLPENARNLYTELAEKLARDGDQSIVLRLEKILKAIRPLNVLEIQRLISKANQAAALIRDKDIVLLIGPTGSGKSTTVQFLAGCKMIRTKVEIAPGKYLSHIEATAESSRNLSSKGIKSSPFSRSETRSIAPIVIQPQDRISSCKNETIILCDGPGFGDTAGPEVDIANSLGVIEALKQVRSVKLLVLSSFDTSGGRGEGIKRLTCILINMIRDITDRLPSVIHVFSKYPPEQDIDSVLTELKRSNIDPSDEAVNTILDDMIEKSSDPCCKIDPLNDSPKHLLKKLQKMKGIQHPSEVFSFPMNDETRHIIDNHIQRDKNYVDYAMKCIDDKLFIYYMNDFRTLVELIPKDEIKNTYRNFLRFIGETLNDYCNTEIKNFNRLLASQDELKEEDVHNYKVSVEFLQQIQIIENVDLPSHLILIQNIVAQLKHMEDSLNDEDLCSPLIGIYLNNFFMIKRIFNQFETAYTTSCKLFEKRLDNLVQSARDAITSNQFETITEWLYKISKSIETLQKHLEQSVAKIYQDIVELFLSHLRQFSNKIESTLHKNTLTNDDIHMLTNDLQTVKSAKDNYALREQIVKYKEILKNNAEILDEKDHIDLDGIYDECVGKIVEFVGEISQRIKVILEKNEEYAIENVEKLVNDMKMIYRIPLIESNIFRMYYTTIENVRNYMHQLQPHTRQLLHDIDQQSANIEDRQLARLITSVKSMKWMDNISPGTYEMSYVRIQQELRDYVQQLDIRLKKLDLSLKHSDNVSIAHDILEKMDYVCTLEQDSYELRQYRENSFNYLIKRVEIVLDRIRKDVNSTLLSDVTIPSSSQRKETLDQIKNDKSALIDQITKMNTYLDVYNKILYSGRNTPISSLLKLFQKTSTSINTREDAMNYIRAHGFHDITALQQTIAKFKAELESIKEHEMRFQLTDNSGETESEEISSIAQPLSEKMNLSVANSALMYAESCEKIQCDRVKEAASHLQKILANHVETYTMSLVEQKIIENFNRIVHRDCQQTTDVYQYAVELKQGLYELHSLRKLNSIFLCIEGDEKIERCKQLCFQHIRMLNHNLEQYKKGGKIQDLKEQLLTAQILTCVDHFFGPEFEENGFGNLYRHYQAELIEGYAQISITILENISRNDYTKVASILAAQMDNSIGNDPAQAQIKHELEFAVNKLMDEIEYRIAYLNESNRNEESIREHVAEIRQNLARFRIIKSTACIKNRLEKKTQASVENFNEKIDSILSTSVFGYLTSIETLIENGNFSEAEKAMSNLKNLQRDLSGYFTREDVIQKDKIVTERLNDIVADVLRNYDFSNISHYPINPPKEILNKIVVAMKLYGEKYSKAHRDILININGTFTSAIVSIRELPLAERIMKLNSLEYALQYLPDELTDSFTLELEKQKRSISEEEHAYTQKIDRYFNDADDDDHIIEKIGELAVQLKEQKLNEQFNQLCNKALKKLFIYRTDVRKAFDQQNIRQGTDIIEKIFKYETYLGTSIVEIRDVWQSVRVLTIQKLRICCKIVAEISLIEEAVTIEKTFDDIVALLECFQNVTELFSSVDLENCIEKIKRMFKYFHDNSMNYRIAFNQMNISEIHKTMTISYKWNNFIEKLKQNRTTFGSLELLMAEMKNVISYRDMLSELTSRVHYLTNQVMVELINSDTTKFEVKRFELHRNIMSSMRTLRAIDSNFHGMFSSILDVKKLEKGVNEKIQTICTRLISTISSEQFSIKEADDFRMFYNHLVSLKNCISFLSVDIQHFLELSEEKILEKVKNFRTQLGTKHISVSDTAKLLCQMKFLAENISIFDKKINEQIDETLKIYREKNGMLNLMKLIVELETSDIGNRMIVEHSSLAGESWKRRRDKMQNQDNLEYVLSELNGDDISKDKLRTRYGIFRKKYDELVSSNLALLSLDTSEQADVSGLVTQVKFLVGSLIKSSQPGSWNHTFIDEIPQILAYIFAIWTLKNTQHYNTMRGIKEAQSYLLMPHVAQVIAIFRLLGIGYNSSGSSTPKSNVRKISNSLVNNLVEIGTGEGKSVVMAITACVFALTGVNVNCSCYSQVLSARDQHEFSSIFNALGVDELIQYGTFDKLCEQFLNNQCDVRREVQKMIQSNQAELKAIDMTMSMRPKILLIDEVDVFLSGRYFGGIYQPVVILKDPSIKALFDSIWENKTLKTLNHIKSLPAYRKCITQYSHWVFLFDTAIKTMLSDLHTFKPPKYTVKNDTICYLQDEMVTDSIVYGYSTMWTYYDEHEKGNITSDSLKKNIGLIVNCGDFSYAEIPHEFSYIAGVTGTLRTLATSEEDILRNIYGIEKNTITPSVFGKSNRTYDKTTDLHVVTETEYFGSIRTEINRIQAAGRAILVFFESERKLMNFFDSSELSSIKTNVDIITELVDVKERELYIKRSSTIGKVTLLTRIFGRGTDFVCDNREILEHGGFHVLQTFFSTELSEEIQIMGRTARQGDRGSYGMILLDKDLEWVLGSDWKNEISKVSSTELYEMIDKSRRTLYEAKCTEKSRRIKHCENEHRLSKAFMTALSRGDMKGVQTFLNDRNSRASSVQYSARTILLLSENYPESTAFKTIRKTISTILERLSVILDEMKMNRNQIEIQFVIDRKGNFTDDAPVKISSWYSAAIDIPTFMMRIKSRDFFSGSDVTGLQHALRESSRSTSISQLIIIGDSLASHEKHIHKRTNYHESYSTTDASNRPAYDCSEIEKLRVQNIPVHTFYLSDNVKNSFREFAKRTGGRCEGRHDYSSRYVERLTDFVVEEIAKQAAGNTAVELYRNRYGIPNSSS